MACYFVNITNSAILPSGMSTAYDQVSGIDLFKKKEFFFIWLIPFSMTSVKFYNDRIHQLFFKVYVFYRFIVSPIAELYLCPSRQWERAH